MARVSMEIRAARNEQIEGGRLRAIVRLGGGVVIGMTGLERVEPRGRERGNQRVALRDAGVRQRRKAAARVNDADHGLGGGAPTRDEGRPAEFEKTGEGLVPRRNVPGVHHRRRDLRPPHAATRGRIFEYRGNVNRVPERGKAIAHLSNAATPLLPLAVEEVAQGRAGRVDEISEDVDVTSVGDGADLDAGHDFEAGDTSGAARGIGAGGGVVIRDADDRQARGAGLVNELRRRQRAVGGVRVQVEIYQAEGRPRR